MSPPQQHSQKHEAKPFLPPTTHLPSIKSILFSSTVPSIDSLHQNLEYLQKIYNPPVRGSKRRTRTAHSISSTTPSSSGLRTDPFERSYALRWLGALIRSANSGVLETHLEGESAQVNGEAIEDLVAHASALLAACSGTSAAGRVQRDFEFDLASSPSDTSRQKIHVTLTDVPLSSISDVGYVNESSKGYFASVGAQTWGGACVLAEEIAAEPARFFPSWLVGHTNATEENRTFRVLELGAGTGLVSLAAGKAAQALLERVSFDGEEAEVEIVATDYFPSVLDNLRENISRNCSSPSSSGGRVKMTTRALDWSTFASTSTTSLSTTASTPSDSAAVPNFSLPSSPTDKLQSLQLAPIPSNDLGSFDLILGADIIYEPLHASWIRNVLFSLLGAEAKFHLVIPLRKGFSLESASIEKVFPFGASTVPATSNVSGAMSAPIDVDVDADTGTHSTSVTESESESAPTETEDSDTDSGVVLLDDKSSRSEGHFSDSSNNNLVILSKETIVCDADSDSRKDDEGEGEVVEYAYYIIGRGVSSQAVLR
ncbi:hypothetical protein VKT23_008655 [Stygiomarasmius scandens]|uniref:S-adenosylmethionine-dependent methyltransferase n=1 Tax=Marasmiellus scandens TaxID=2682957 RepID=A0ABR1JJU7_9AGAR